MKRVAVVALLVLCPFVMAQRRLRMPPVQPVTVPPDVPFATPDPDFPLRVHLLVARWGGTGGVYHGYGSGNLLNANGPQGFDYAFQCLVPFVVNETPNDTYQARWAGSPYKLEILTGEVGTDRTHECTLRLAYEDKPFEPDNTAAMTHGVSSSLQVRWIDPGFAYLQPAPDYPVHFHVVEGQRKEDAAGDHGWGTANVSEPGSPAVLGAEYTYDCWGGFLTNSQLSGFYQGHWVKQGTKLEVLLQRPGSDKIDKCRVEVNMQPQPYPEARHIHPPDPPAFSTPAGSTP